MKDIRATLFRYLDCKQHLWNTYFVGDVIDIRQCEPLESFDSIDLILFKSLVCRPLGIHLPESFVLGGDVVPEIKVRASPNLTSIPVMTSEPRTGPNMRWKLPEVLDANGLELSFIAFFQWNKYSYLSMGSVRCKVTKCPSSPQYVGMESLIENQNADFFVDWDGVW
jgi:hypothetical protein